jgi:hypothetical protein
MVINRGREFKAEVLDLLNEWGVERIQISAYHAQANGMIERGHGPLKNALSKLGSDWPTNLTAVLFADRTTVHRPTGYTPFYMIYGREPILPVESRFPTWRTLFTEEITDRSKLIEVRARQFQMREEDVNEAIFRKTRRRQEGKEAFDARHNIRTRPFQVGDIVLRYDSQREVDISSDRKLDFRWLGPYEIYSANNDKGYFKLKEMGPDGVHLKGTFAGSRLKLFFKRERYLYSPDDIDSEPDNENQQREELGDIEDQEQGTVQTHNDKGFVIRLPTLTAEQRSQYIRYDYESDEGSETRA